MLNKSIVQTFDNVEVVNDDLPCLNRRGFLKAAACTAGVFATSPALAKVAGTRERALSIYVPRSGETMRLVYWTPTDGYIRESIKELSWALRDHRNNNMKMMDPKLLDQLYGLQLKMDRARPTHVISGYRSPQTNAMLRRTNRAVAKNSFHMYGKAVDIRMPDRSTSALRQAALSLQAGGVGYYRRSKFIHIDTGDIRTWSR